MVHLSIHNKQFCKSFNIVCSNTQAHWKQFESGKAGLNTTEGNLTVKDKLSWEDWVMLAVE